MKRVALLLIDLDTPDACPDLEPALQAWAQSVRFAVAEGVRGVGVGNVSVVIAEGTAAHLAAGILACRPPESSDG